MCRTCKKIDRRKFVGIIATVSAAPAWAVTGGSVLTGELFNNFSPSQQLFTAQIVNVLAHVTRFDFHPRLVSAAEAGNLAKAIRSNLLEFSSAAVAAFDKRPFEDERMALAWLAEDEGCQRLLRLEAFVRAGSFRIKRNGHWVVLSGVT